MDYYQVLGITQSATRTEIRRAYLRLTALHHPDLNPGVDTLKRIREIHEAYEVLSDSHKRAKYDSSPESFDDSTVVHDSTVHTATVHSPDEEATRPNASDFGSDYVSQSFQSHPASARKPRTNPSWLGDQDPLNYTESNSNPIFALGMVFLTVVTVVLGCIAYQRHLADVAVDLANRQVVNEYLLPDAGRPRNRWNEPASPDTKDRVENTPEERPEKDHAEKPIASTRKSASAGSTTIPSIAVPNLSAATEFGAIPFGGLPDFNGSTTIPTSDPTLQNQFQDLGKLSPEEFERHLTQFVEDSQDFGPESMHNSLEELIGTGIGVNQSNEQGFRPPYRPFNQPRTSTPAGPSYAYEGVGLSPTNSGIPPTNYRAPGHTSASSPLPGTNLPTPSVSKPWSARSTRPGEHGLSDSTGVVPIVKRSHNRMTGYPSIGSSGNLPNLAYPSMPPAPRAPAGPMAPGMNPGVNSGIRHGAGISTSIGPLVGPQNNLSTALPPLPGNGGPTKPPTQYGSGYGGSPNPGGPLTMARPVPPTGNGASSSQWPSVPSTNASRFSPGF